MFEVENLFCRADKDGIKIDDIRGYILSHLSEIILKNTYLSPDFGAHKSDEHT